MKWNMYLKNEIDSILSPPYWLFLHSLPFHQLSVHNLNKGSHLMLEPGILLPLPERKCFLQFVYRVALHLYSKYGVNLLSRTARVTKCVHIAVAGRSRRARRASSPSRAMLGPARPPSAPATSTTRWTSVTRCTSSGTPSGWRPRTARSRSACA